jgi:hypothetical protein
VTTTLEVSLMERIAAEVPSTEKVVVVEVSTKETVTVEMPSPMIFVLEV